MISSLLNEIVNLPNGIQKYYSQTFIIPFNNIRNQQPTQSPSSSPTQAPTESPSSSPTQAPTPQVLLACGASVGACSGQTQVANINESHEVRCCKDSSTNPGDPWRRFRPVSNGGTCPNNIWGESEDANGVCQDASNYEDAELMCAELGGRLCTAAELLDDCVRGTGCDFDDEMIWSSSPVGGLGSRTLAFVDRKLEDDDDVRVVYQCKGWPLSVSFFIGWWKSQSQRTYDILFFTYHTTHLPKTLFFLRDIVPSLVQLNTVVL